MRPSRPGAPWSEHRVWGGAGAPRFQRVWAGRGSGLPPGQSAQTFPTPRPADAPLWAWRGAAGRGLSVSGSCCPEQSRSAPGARASTPLPARMGGPRGREPPRPGPCLLLLLLQLLPQMQAGEPRGGVGTLEGVLEGRSRAQSGQAGGARPALLWGFRGVTSRGV